MQHFKGKGTETIHIVRATQLGLLLMCFEVSASSTRPQRLGRNADKEDRRRPTQVRIFMNDIDNTAFAPFSQPVWH